MQNEMPSNQLVFLLAQKLKGNVSNFHLEPQHIQHLKSKGAQISGKWLCQSTVQTAINSVHLTRVDQAHSGGSLLEFNQ